tara:strand:- start:32 stop:418 length:387 start_codon:yes stop_codon:yes gene_type:complete
MNAKELAALWNNSDPSVDEVFGIKGEMQIGQPQTKKWEYEIVWTDEGKLYIHTLFVTLPIDAVAADLPFPIRQITDQLGDCPWQASRLTPGSFCTHHSKEGLASGKEWLKARKKASKASDGWGGAPLG